MDEELTVGAVYETEDKTYGYFVYLVLERCEHPWGFPLPAWRVLMLKGGYPLTESGFTTKITTSMWAWSQARRIV